MTRWTNASEDYLLPQSAGHSDAWSKELAAAGLTGSQRLVDVSEVVPPEDITRALGLSTGSPVIHRSRVMYVGEAAVELTDSYYPPAIARGTGLAEHRKIRGGAVTLLAELGYAPRFSREDVTARMPTPDERATLGLGPDEPVLVLCRLTYAAENVPVELSMMVMPARDRHLTYRMQTDEAC